MDARRRTLADGPAGNGAFHPYAAPASAMKKGGAMRGVGAARMSMIPQSGGGRMSLAPGGFGVSAAHGGQPGLGVSVASSQDGARRSTLMRAPESAGRGDAGIYGRTPQTGRMVPGSARRSSVYSGPRASMAPSFGATQTKDTRPIRSVPFIQACARNIADFLHAHRYPHAMTPKLLTSPTAREFQTLVRFLLCDMIDPAMKWERKFEDDVIAGLKDLRYPAIENVGKTALTAPGSPQNWPHMVAMLNWLVDLCRAHDTWDDPEIVNDVLLTPATELPLDAPNLEDRLLWHFTDRTYREWYHEGAEEFAAAEQELAEIFDRLAATSIAECEALETKVNKKTVELRQLQAQEPPLKKLEEEYVQLMSDKTKFIAFIDLHRQKADKLRAGIAKARGAIGDQLAQIDAAKAELAQTEAAVAAQNLSPDEVNRMNHERETLTRNLDEVRAKIAEASQAAYDQEMLVTKSMDRFEQLLADYTALGHQIGTIPAVHDGAAPSAGPGGVDYTIDLDLGMEDLAELQATGRQAVAIVRPALAAYGDDWRAQMREMQDRLIVLEDEHDQLGQKVERMKEEVGNLEMKLKVVHEQAEEARSQLQAETTEMNRTVTKLETEVSAMASASQQGVLTVQTTLEHRKIEFEELRHKTANLADAVVKQLMEHADTIIKAKDHTLNSLKSVRTFAEAQ
ncbi:kinetochore-associated Ndc80 complex subunit ndc80 [Cryptotrichosporon argae]